MARAKKKTHNKGTSGPTNSGWAGKGDLGGNFIGRNEKTYRTVAGIVIAIVAMVLGMHLYKLHQDSQRFEWASQRLSYIQSQLNKVTGVNVSSSISKSCALNTEQPFNNSVTCSVDLDASFTAIGQDATSNAEGSIRSLLNSQSAFGNLINPAVTPSSTGFNVASKGLNCVSNFDETPSIGMIKPGQKVYVQFSDSCFAPSEKIFD